MTLNPSPICCPGVGRLSACSVAAGELGVDGRSSNPGEAAVDEEASVEWVVGRNMCVRHQVRLGIIQDCSGTCGGCRCPGISIVRIPSVL